MHLRPLPILQYDFNIISPENPWLSGTVPREPRDARPRHAEGRFTVLRRKTPKIRRRRIQQNVQQNVQQKGSKKVSGQLEELEVEVVVCRAIRCAMPCDVPRSPRFAESQDEYRERKQRSRSKVPGLASHDLIGSSYMA